jgi:hypothetical protein
MNNAAKSGRGMGYWELTSRKVDSLPAHVGTELYSQQGVDNHLGAKDDKKPLAFLVDGVRAQHSNV